MEVHRLCRVASLPAACPPTRTRLAYIIAIARSRTSTPAHTLARSLGRLVLARPPRGGWSACQCARALAESRPNAPSSLPGRLRCACVASSPALLHAGSRSASRATATWAASSSSVTGALRRHRRTATSDPHAGTRSRRIEGSLSISPTCLATTPPTRPPPDGARATCDGARATAIAWNGRARRQPRGRARGATRGATRGS